MKLINISVPELVFSISEMVDLVSPQVEGHHRRVGCISLWIADYLGMDEAGRFRLCLSALLHDIGALSVNERLETLEFETKNTWKHSEMGYRLLKSASVFLPAAEIIRYHHYDWNFGKGQFYNAQKIPIESHILHLADRIDVLLDKNEDLISQKEKIIQMVQNHSGSQFSPDLVEAFLCVSEQTVFWEDLTSNKKVEADFLSKGQVLLESQELMDIANIFHTIIDFRSRYTATHSSGVAAVACRLAELSGMDSESCRQMKIAGYLHDIGKLAIPKELLEKPGSLTDVEYDTLKKHTLYSHRILSGIAGFDRISQWASHHHELLDGGGYPFNLKSSQIPIGTRIMTVSDIFTALSEDRPYRKGMNLSSALKIIEEMVNNGKLDGEVVSNLIKNSLDIDRVRKSQQLAAQEQYWDVMQTEE